MKSKRLLQISAVVNSTAPGRIAEEIGQTAIAAGWESYIAYGRNERPSASKLIRIGTDTDIKLHGLQTRLFDRHGLGSKSATRELIGKIEGIAPDIIHLHNIHGYYINIEVLFNYLQDANIPVVWTFHDCWPITGHCSYFTFVGCDRWKTECHSCPQKTRYPSSYFIDRSKKNFILKKELFNSLSSLTLVPVSQWLSGILNESFLQRYPIRVVNNGVNLDVFKPSPDVIKPSSDVIKSSSDVIEATSEEPTLVSAFRERNGFEDKFILLGVASVWAQRKGLKDFIELSKRLDSDFKIVLVGLTKKQLEQLPDNILGIERTENVGELAELYAASDVFLNPTYEDNFPTTNLESLACGTPVITYKTGGSPEAIDDSTGIVVEQGNIDKLIEAILQLKQKGKQYYSDACVSRAHRLYKKEDRYKDYLDLYETLIK